MRDILAEIPADATVEEPEDAAEGIREVIARLAAAESGPGRPGRCPRCGCETFVRKGRDRDGSRRWLCRGCGRTFTARTMGLLTNSRLPPQAWEAFAACMAAAMTLRDTAARVGVCLSTAWFMRHRVCEALGRLLEPFGSGDGVEAQVDGTLVAESAKGRHRSGFPLPREPRRRGGQVHARGVSSEQANVICGANDRGGAFLGLAGRGRCTDEQVRGALAGRIAAGTSVATDGHPAYGRALPGLGASHESFESGTPEANQRLALVNSLHSRLKAFLGRFRGVSTRRLSLHLAWFAWREQASVGAADIDRFPFRRECEGRYSTTRREVWRVPLPFVEYWGVSEVV